MCVMCGACACCACVRACVCVCVRACVYSGASVRGEANVQRDLVPPNGTVCGWVTTKQRVVVLQPSVTIG